MISCRKGWKKMQIALNCKITNFISVTAGKDRMSKQYLMVMLFSLLFVSVSIYGQGRSRSVTTNAIRDTKLKLMFSETARVEAGNVATYSDPKKKWLLIEVEYTLPGNDTIGRTRWLDDMKVKFQVMYPAYYQGRNVTALLSGETVFWSVPFDGKRHYAVGFIPPQVIKRYSRPGTRIRASFTRTLEARVTFYTSSNRIIGRAFYSDGSSSTKLHTKFTAAEKALGVLRLDGLILSRNETPWANLQWDKYELIKIKK